MKSAAVVLCAEHSVNNQEITDLRVLVSYRLQWPDAPSGWYHEGDDRDGAGSKWIPKTPSSNTYLTGRVMKRLESGGEGIDYALLLVEFALVAPAAPYKRFGRVLSPVLSKDLLLVSHPEPYKIQDQCEPTQASAGHKIRDRGTLRPDDSTDYYAFAWLSATSGSSGGGVYNTSGVVVGVLQGYAASGGSPGRAFLNLGAVVDAKPKGTELLQRYMAGGRYLVGP